MQCLIVAAQRHNAAGDRVVLIGDLNSGRNETDIEVNVRSGKLLDEFSTADLYQELERQWTEAWAHLHPGEYEFSWYPFRRDPAYRSRSGWRIDKAFISPALLPTLRSAAYDHVFRLDGLSDHSGLLIDIGARSPGTAAGRGKNSALRAAAQPFDTGACGAQLRMTRALRSDRQWR